MNEWMNEFLQKEHNGPPRTCGKEEPTPRVRHSARAALMSVHCQRTAWTRPLLPQRPQRRGGEAASCGLSSDPALGGSASTRHRPPPTNGWTAPQLLTELRATLPTATPAQPRLTLHHQPVPTGSAGQHFPTRRTRWLTGWLAGSGDDSRSSTTSLECFS